MDGVRKLLWMVLALAMAATPASAWVVSGAMQHDDIPATVDVDGQGNGWPLGFSIAWEVSTEEPGGPMGYPWYYEYTINVARFAPRRLIVETGDNFTSSNVSTVRLFQNTVEQPGYSDWSVGTQPATNPPNRDMPEAVYGILFDSIGTGSGSDEEVMVSFWSDIAPAWGDVYTRCDGNGNRAFNLGFVADDPGGPPTSGVNQNHLLGPVPEPTTVCLMCLGGVGLFLVRARRKP